MFISDQLSDFTRIWIDAFTLFPLTLVLLRVFPKYIFLRGVVATPLWIINTEGHITLNLLPVYRYGYPLSIDTKISTNH